MKKICLLTVVVSILCGGIAMAFDKTVKIDVVDASYSPEKVLFKVNEDLIPECPSGHWIRFVGRSDVVNQAENVKSVLSVLMAAFVSNTSVRLVGPSDNNADCAVDNVQLVK